MRAGLPGWLRTNPSRPRRPSFAARTLAGCARRGGRLRTPWASDATKCTRPRRKNSSEAEAAVSPKSPRRLAAVSWHRAPRATRRVRRSGSRRKRGWLSGCAMTGDDAGDRELVKRGLRRRLCGISAGSSTSKVSRTVETGERTLLPCSSSVSASVEKRYSQPGQDRGPAFEQGVQPQERDRRASPTSSLIQSPREARAVWRRGGSRRRGPRRGRARRLRPTSPGRRRGPGRQ